MRAAGRPDSRISGRIAGRIGVRLTRQAPAWPTALLRVAGRRRAAPDPIRRRPRRRHPAMTAGGVRSRRTRMTRMTRMTSFFRVIHPSSAASRHGGRGPWPVRAGAWPPSAQRRAPHPRRAGVRYIGPRMSSLHPRPLPDALLQPGPPPTRPARLQPIPRPRLPLLFSPRRRHPGPGPVSGRVHVPSARSAPAAQAQAGSAAQGRVRRGALAAGRDAWQAGQGEASDAAALGVLCGRGLDGRELALRTKDGYWSVSLSAHKRCATSPPHTMSSCRATENHTRHCIQS